MCVCVVAVWCGDCVVVVWCGGCVLDSGPIKVPEFKPNSSSFSSDIPSASSAPPVYLVVIGYLAFTGVQIQGIFSWQWSRWDFRCPHCGAALRWSGEERRGRFKDRDWLEKKKERDEVCEYHQCLLLL